MFLYMNTTYQVCPPPPVRTPTPGDHQIYNFGKVLSALHHYAFGFSQTCAVVKKKIFENWSFLGSFLPSPQGPRYARDLKFTI